MPDPSVHDMRVPTSIEGKFHHLEGRHNLLEHSTSQSLQNVLSAVSSMQGDVREQSRNMQEMKLELHGMRAHSEGLDRLGKLIESAVARWDKEFRDHCAENKVTSDAVTGFKGALRAMSLVLMIIAGMAVAILDYRFTAVHDTVTEVRGSIREVKASIARSENRIERLEQAK